MGYSFFLDSHSLERLEDRRNQLAHRANIHAGRPQDPMTHRCFVSFMHVLKQNGQQNARPAPTRTKDKPLPPPPGVESEADSYVSEAREAMAAPEVDSRRSFVSICRRN
jgi:hypothetical protein